jgi:Zn finger protein HypA/HybF involved in hydrogenase expression
MHELSIAEALIDLLRRRAGPEAKLVSVGVRIGALQGIDGQCLQFAWQAALSGTNWQDVRLDLESAPWTLHCPACGRTWQPAAAIADQTACPCGPTPATLAGGDELDLLFYEVQTPAASGVGEGVYSSTKGDGP